MKLTIAKLQTTCSLTKNLHPCTAGTRRSTACHDTPRVLAGAAVGMARLPRVRVSSCACVHLLARRMCAPTCMPHVCTYLHAAATCSCSSAGAASTGSAGLLFLVFFDFFCLLYCLLFIVYCLLFIVYCSGFRV